MLRKFTLTEDHIILLKEMHVVWLDGEPGAPGIDTKRPYGNGEHLGDIALALRLRKNRNELSYHPLNDKEEAFCQSLHEELHVALQIVLCTGKFKAGKYHKADPLDGRSWEIVKA